MNESELYKELELKKDRNKWNESIPYVSSFLTHKSVKIQAKALWLLGEIGLAYSQSVQDDVPLIASFCDSPVPLLRERAVNALGRIGRGNYHVVKPYWTNLFRYASDEDAKVRLSFIWASENIATNTPDIYAKKPSIVFCIFRSSPRPISGIIISGCGTANANTMAMPIPLLSQYFLILSQIYFLRSFYHICTGFAIGCALFLMVYGA